MMEQPVDLKPGKGKPRGGLIPKNERICIIYFASTADKVVNPMTEQGFEKIKDVTKVRLAHSDPKHRLEDISKHLTQSLDASVHGSHRRCYQLYTVSRLSKKRSSDVACTSPSDAQSSTSKLRRSSSSLSVSSPLFPPDKCLFCNKQYVKFKRTRRSLIKCVSKVKR